jgi:TrmH family RNA methyltransferase
VEFIGSRQNPRIRDLLLLRKPEMRRQRGEFLIEGLRETARAAENFFEICEVFVTAEALPSLPTALLGKKITQVSGGVFEKISLRENCDGVLCRATIPRRSFPESLPADALIVVAEHLEKPGNLGALLRSMEAAGCCLCLLSDPLTDPWNPNVIRASQGALFALPPLTCSNGEALHFLRHHRIPIAATSPSAGTSYWGALPPPPLAIIAGNEHSGLSEFWLRAADYAVSIPMRGQTGDSLNVATATTLCLYESLRSRWNARGVATGCAAGNSAAPEIEKAKGKDNFLPAATAPRSGRNG